MALQVVKEKIKSLIGILITKHRISIYLGVFSLATYFRFSNEIFTLLDADSAGYLDPALRYILSGEFDHVNARSYPYPVFVLTILTLFKNINALCLIQHLLSLSTLVLSLFFFENKILINKKNSNLKFILFVAFISLCFINGNLIFYEKHLRPEGLLLPSMFLTIYILYKLSNNRTSKPLVLLSIAVFLVLAYLFPRSSIGYYLLILIIYLVYVKNQKWNFKKFLINHFMLLFFASLAILPEKYLINKYEPMSSEFAYKQFFFSNLYAVEKAVQNKDYIDAKFDSTELKKIIHESLHHSKRGKKSVLNYDIDYAQYELLKEQPTDNYFESWFYHLLKKYPVEVATKTTKQLINFIFSTKVLFMNGGYSEDSKHAYHKDSLEISNFIFQIHTEHHYIKLLKKLHFNPEGKLLNTFPFTRIQILYFQAFYIWKLLFFCTLPFYIKLIFKSQKWFLEILVMVFFISSVFTISAIHTVDNDRYIISLMPIFMFLSITYLYHFFTFFSRNLPPSAIRASLDIPR